MKPTDIFAGIAAGFAIGIGATIYLTVGGIVGAFMFSIGLISVILYRLPLFTGQAWKVWGWKGMGWLIIVLLCNLVGVIFAPLICFPTAPEQASAIIQSRIAQGCIISGLKAIPCGFLMTAAVRGAAAKNLWPLLLGVPTFILCGFPHCIADMFYIGFCEDEQAMTFILTIYPAIVIGNYLGCNLYRVAGIPKIKQ